ncbi:PadR family transcriptional regulator [uncultured Deinococcus sp.]|uniref:PadR family transcriptional regulator n=1 Tax=uncultured Deinococcus sp. TaxID=158789 RepID=UPI0025F5AF0D|nr:helix-turn-helix transcriptional regulator [uncultured Deinococcus sp.]
MPPTAQLNRNALRVMGLMYHDTARQHYGLSISQELQLGNGTLYPILDKLETWGLIAAEQEPPSGEGRRPRWYYHLTGEGVRRYEAERALLFPEPAAVRHA